MTGKMFVLAALGAFAAATPAAAQWNGSVVDTQSLRAQIEDGVARGDIDAEEAASLRSQLRGLMNLQRHYGQDGLSASEREDLRQRAQGLRNEIVDAQGQEAPPAYSRYNYAPNGYSRYGNGYGNGYNADQGAYGSRYGGGYGAHSNAPYGSQAYGNRSYGNAPYDNGGYGSRYGNDRYDEDEAYPDTSERGQRYDRGNGYDRDDSYDRDDQGGYALRVGDRASGGLYAVPDAYRDRFRDGGGVYYRYGNGSVYQIDARTGTVLRIYPLNR